MANVFSNEYTFDGMKAYVFTDTSTGTTSACQMPINARVLNVSYVVNSATGRAATIQYTASTGVVTLGGLTAADSIIVTVYTN